MYNFLYFDKKLQWPQLSSVLCILKYDITYNFPNIFDYFSKTIWNFQTLTKLTMTTPLDHTGKTFQIRISFHLDVITVNLTTAWKKTVFYNFSTISRKLNRILTKIRNCHISSVLCANVNTEALFVPTVSIPPCGKHKKIQTSKMWRIWSIEVLQIWKLKKKLEKLKYILMIILEQAEP